MHSPVGPKTVVLALPMVRQVPSARRTNVGPPESPSQPLTRAAPTWIDVVVGPTEFRIGTSAQRLVPNELFTRALVKPNPTISTFTPRARTALSQPINSG